MQRGSLQINGHLPLTILTMRLLKMTLMMIILIQTMPMSQYQFMNHLLLLQQPTIFIACGGK